MIEEPGASPPLACNLAAMTAAQRERHRLLGELLRRETESMLELPDGFEFRLSPLAWFHAAEFVSLEQLCCPFVRFTLELEENGGPLRLRLTGREGVRQLLRAELQLPSRIELPG